MQLVCLLVGSFFLLAMYQNSTIFELVNNVNNVHLTEGAADTRVLSAIRQVFPSGRHTFVDHRQLPGNVEPLTTALVFGKDHTRALNGAGITVDTLQPCNLISPRVGCIKSIKNK